MVLTFSRQVGLKMSCIHPCVCVCMRERERERERGRERERESERVCVCVCVQALSSLWAVFSEPQPDGSSICGALPAPSCPTGLALLHPSLAPGLVRSLCRLIWVSEIRLGSLQQSWNCCEAEGSGEGKAEMTPGRAS